MPRLLTCISSLALVAASPAMAQVSAADLWAEWQATSAAVGQDMTADVTQTGDGLILDNFMTRTEADGTTTLGQLDRVTMTEMPDGSLSVALSNPYTTTITFPEEVGGPMITLEVLVSHEGLDIAVTGEADARRYVYSADAVTVSEGAISNDQGDPTPSIDMEITARDLTATYLLSGEGGDTQSFEATSTVASLAGRLDMLPPPDEEGRLKANFALGEMQSNASGSIVALAAMQRSASGLPEGFDVEGTTDYAWSRFEMSFEEPGEGFALYFANDGGSLGVALSNAELRYDIAAEGMETRISGVDIPGTLGASAASSELMLTVPLAASDMPSDAAIRLSYRDLAVTDETWSLIDPTATLPRNPLTVVLDATAQIQLAVDLLSDSAMEMERPPGELRALSVSELEVSYGDTALTGSADMTFAPGQGMPQPVGRAELSLAGGNALLDRLQAAGVVNAEQAGMARGVVGMFTRPGAMPDMIETTIEFLEGGSITANGVPLQ